MAQKENEFESMMGSLREESLSEIFGYGTWHRFENLQEVLDKMDRKETGEEDKHSIPDVYGRAIQLRISLETLKRKSDLEEKYFLTREILGWRGILTMLALQKFLHLKISLEKMIFKKNEIAFDKALKYAPAADIPNLQEGWKDGVFYIIKIKGDKEVEETDIALFSPMTVVYPVADLEKKLPMTEELKWFDYTKRKFLNPATVLTKTEKIVVCVWLENLQKILRENAYEQGQRAVEVVDILVFHLDAYKTELRRELLDSEWMQKNCFKMECIDAAFSSSSETVVNNIINTTVKLCFYFENDKKARYEELFAEQLYCVARDKNPLKGCRFSEKHKIAGTENMYAFIPFGKKMINICSKKTIAELVNHLEMKLVDKDYGCRPYIQVDLFLSKISNEYVDVEKKYYLNQEDEETNGILTQVVEEDRDFPVIAVWPSECYEGCKKYYIYLADEKRSVIVDLDDVKQGSNWYVKQTERFPYAIPMKRAGKYDIGMVFPEYTEEIKEKTASIYATVGIDFGTSGTTVYAKLDAEGSIFPVNVCGDEPRYLTSIGDAAKEMMNEYFIAESRQDKLYSVYRRSSEGLLNEPEPILDGVIYQAGEEKILEKSETDIFMSDIKWENPNNGAYYQVFIEELCLHVCQTLRSKGVTSIKWKYALPLSIKDKDTYRDMWKEKIKVFLNNSISSIHHVIEDREYSESEAVSLYFLYSNELEAVNKKKGYMVVDIGGGSTDIAVWQKKQNETEVSMIAQTSVPVAGRILFTRWFLLNIMDMNQEVFKNEEEIRKQLQRVKEISNQQIANIFLDRIVNNQYDLIMKNYKQQGRKWSQRLKRQLEFGMALMFFSMGSLVGHLVTMGALQRFAGNGNFNIALGGNGSKILNWTTQKDELLKMFQAGVESRNVSSESFHPGLFSSHKPKEEVAYGLLQESVINKQKEPTDVKETVTDAMAIQWNKAFIQKYKELFEEEIDINPGEICDIMSNVDRHIDVCNFFMNVMYVQYYKKKLV